MTRPTTPALPPVTHGPCPPTALRELLRFSFLLLFFFLEDIELVALTLFLSQAKISMLRPNFKKIITSFFKEKT